MAGYTIKTFTSTNTGDTEESCVIKWNEILSQVAGFICELIPEFTVTECVFDESTGQKKYEIGRANGTVKLALHPYSKTIFNEVYWNLKINNKNTTNGYYTKIQSAPDSAGAAKLKVAYATGINGDIAIWILGYNEDAPITAIADFMYLNATECGGTDTAKFMCVSADTGIHASTDDDITYQKDNAIPHSKIAIFRLAGGSHDVIVPLPINGTKYIADNAYMFTNSSGISEVTAIQDADKRYLFLKPGQTVTSFLMRIE